MAHPERSAQSPVETPSTSIAAIALRVLWMFGGMFGLLLNLLAIARHSSSTFSIFDAVYVVLVSVVILARYLDITRFNGCTTYGEPATMGHWRRYAIVLGVAAIIGWFVAHGVAMVLG